MLPPNFQPLVDSIDRAIPSSQRFWRRGTYWAIACLTMAPMGCQPVQWNRLANQPSSSLMEMDTPPSPMIESESRLKLSRSNSKPTNSTNPVKRLQRLAGSRVSDHDTPSSLGDSNIIDSATPEADLNQSLADLPPALQELLSKQVAAVEQHRKGAKPAEEPEEAAWEEVKLAKPKRSSKVGDSTKLASNSEETSPVSVQPTKPAIVKMSLSDKDDADVASAVVPASSTDSDRKESLNSDASRRSLEAASEPESWNRSIAKAIELLEKQLKDSTITDENLRLNQHATLRMLQLAAGKIDEAMSPIDGLDEKEQDYFRYQLQAFHEAINPDGVPVRSRRWSLVMNSQRKATDHLASVSNLELRTLEFCTAVDGYGVITKFPARSFKADQDVLLYCELENVAAEALKSGFETQLQGSYEVFDRNGARVAEQLLPVEKEVCMNRRRDYFIVYHIYMPSNLPNGSYSLKLTVEDMKARKFGQSSIDFQIGK